MKDSEDEVTSDVSAHLLKKNKHPRVEPSDEEDEVVGEDHEIAAGVDVVDGAGVDVVDGALSDKHEVRTSIYCVGFETYHVEEPRSQQPSSWSHPPRKTCKERLHT